METKMIETRNINKVLVANRGEIAVRIFDTLHQMGICSVAVYAEADAESLHSRSATERHLLKGKTLAETYLNALQLIDIAKSCGVDAIHPGYGFLSENPDFAQSVVDAGLIFIGPSAEAIRKMGNKKQARAIAKELGIPVAEGAEGTKEQLIEKAKEIDYPLMIKAAAGGGGKGMRIVHSEDQLSELLEATQREAQNYFGNPEVYIEKYLPNPRHIEIQVLGDKHGQVVTLFERECSIQRRHQKIIEEAPASNLAQPLRDEMQNAARMLAHNIQYESAGTVEFLVKGESFYFLEMNTRIQVEHPVTELVTGIDLVKEQIKIASGRPLGFSQKDININGHAIEARVYAEDPDNDFIPSPGDILLHQKPEGNRLRIDSSLDGPGTVSSLYDPMISKVIFHASTRETARKKLIQHLKDYVILGVKTNLAYLTELLSSKAFIEGTFYTRLIDDAPELFGKERNKPIANKLLLAMAYMFIHKSGIIKANHIWQSIGPWRLMPSASLLIDEEKIEQDYIYHTPSELTIKNGIEQKTFRLLSHTDHKLIIEVDGTRHTIHYLAINGEVIFQHEALATRVKPLRYLGQDILGDINSNPELEGETIIRAPMLGTVVKVAVNEGDLVNKGDTLIILESMKMENKIAATARAFVKKVEVTVGDVVPNDSPLVQLTNILE
jgi:3-methylcrotonyl-CoA carboxylase alpha subunit